MEMEIWRGHLNVTWNVQEAELKDIEGGAASIHDKHWRPGTGLDHFQDTWKGRMIGFWEGREAKQAGGEFSIMGTAGSRSLG